MNHRPDDLPTIPLRAAPLHAVAGTSVAAMLLALGIAALTHGQAPAAGVQAGGAPAAPAMAAPADSEPLSGTFIDVRGKVQWRSGPDAPWQPAKVNDVIASGAEVRSGLNSHAALKLGSNATALIDAGTMFQVPTVVREGDVLRTVVAVKSGRADFKVDKVGLSNDFKVVTPSTTLAVRGTGFAVATGALKQVEVLGARRNAINAIQLKYALTNTTVQMSGGAASSSSVQQPTHNALVSTAPPTTAGALPSTNVAETVVQAAVGQSPANAGSPANSQQGNTATTKSQNSVAKVTDAKTDGDGIVAQINRAIVQRGADASAEAERTVAQARAAVDAGIQLLLADLGEQDLIDANALALEKLRLLAVARRDSALAALERHEAERAAANAAEGQALDRKQAFDQREHDLGSQLSGFDSSRGQALGSLQQIRDFLDAGGDTDVDPAEVVGWVEQASERLESMGELLSAGMGSLLAMDGELDQVDAIVDGLNALEGGARHAAQSAIADYQLARGHLILAVQQAGSAEGIARAARDTVSSLEALVRSLADARAAPELIAHAQAAAARLADATADLDRAIMIHGAVSGARDIAQNDGRASHLGAVEDTFQRIVVLRAGLVARWLVAEGEVDVRDGQLAGALGEAEDIFAQLSGFSRSEAEDRLAEARVSEGVARVARDDAQSARDVDEQSVVNDAGAMLASVLGKGTAASGFRAQAGEALTAAGQHGAAFDAALASGAASQTDAGRIDAVSDARVAFESMRDALVALAAHETSVRSALAGSPGEADLSALLGRAEDAIDRMLAARNAASAAAGDAQEQAASAREIADAMGAVLALAEGLEDLYSSTYGMDAQAVRDGESAARVAAGAAEAARDAAALLRDAAAAIHGGAVDADRVGALVASIRDSLDANAIIADAAAADRASGAMAFVTRAGTAGEAAESLAAAAVGRATSALDAAGLARDDVDTALAAHGTARDGAQAARQAAGSMDLAFRARLGDFEDAAGAFGAGQAASAVALGQIAGMVAAANAATDAELGQAGILGSAAFAQAAAAKSALESMDDALRGAGGMQSILALLDADRAAIDALVADLGATEVPAAAAAISAYNAAMSQLAARAAAGAGAEAVATAARDAIVALQGMIDGLDGVLSDGDRLALESGAAARLGAAAAALSSAAEARGAIDALRASGASASAGAGFGDVDAAESFASGIADHAAGAIEGANGVMGRVTGADTALAEAIARTQAGYSDLAAAGARFGEWLDDATAGFHVAASEAHAGAVAAREAADGVSGDAGAFHARASARLSSAQSAAGEASAARGQLDVHSAGVVAALGGLDSEHSHSFTFPSGTYGTRQHSTVTSGPLNGNIVGFTISFSFQPITPSTWASDAALAINGLQWGGFNGYTFPGVTQFVTDWPFHGEDLSGSAGQYGATVSGLSIPTSSGVTLLFGNGWNVGAGVADAHYENISLVLRSTGSGGYSPASASAQAASIASAASSLEAMRASLDAVAFQRDALERLADRAAWNAESAQLQARADAARASVQSALASAVDAAGNASLAASDLEALAGVMESFAAAASAVEDRFGERGFSAEAVGSAANDVSGRVSTAQDAALAAAQLRELVGGLADEAVADDRVAQALALAKSVLDSSDPSVNALFATAQSQVSSGAAAFVERAGAASDRFAEYGLSASNAAAAARAGAGDRASVAEPLRQMVVLRGDAQSRDQAVRAAEAAFNARRGEFASARSEAVLGLEVLPAAAAGTAGMPEAAAVKAALDRMETALVGSVGMASEAARLSAAMGDTQRYAELDALATEASAALDALLAAVIPTASFASDAQAAAAAARAASDAASRIIAISDDLETRFGLSGSGIRSAAQSAADRATASEADRLAASEASDRVGGLASSYGTVQAIEALRLEIEAALALTNGDAAGFAGADPSVLAEARAQHAEANRQGTITFGGLTVARGLQSLATEASAEASFDRLGGLAGRLDGALADLDGHESAAGAALGRASDARQSAESARDLAVGHRNDAEQSFGSALHALGVEDAYAAALHRDAAGQSASSAEFESGRAAGFRDVAIVAHGEVQAASVAFDARLGAFASQAPEQQGQAAFLAAVTTERDAVVTSSSLAGTLAQQAAYFDGVAQVLAGRVAGEGLGQVLADSSAALQEAQRVATELVGLSGQASSMAAGASTNAGRLFGRSLANYVTSAQQQVDLAAAAATAAGAAAIEARGFADQAHAAVQQHGQGQAIPQQ